MRCWIGLPVNYAPQSGHRANHFRPGQSMGEFDLIKRFFTPSAYSPDVLLGVGDDAAVLAVSADHRLVAAVDTIVAGVHFPDETLAFDIGWRALAVNLSDIAAMGAIPRWMTLSLCIPNADEQWLAEFARGLTALAQQHAVQLVGGDTVKGPCNISLQILGVVEADRWLTRVGAKPGDLLYVSGTLGDAGGGLRVMQQRLDTSENRAWLLQRFLRPEPRVSLGRGLRSFATSAMDVSDGLLTDLRKLTAASGCGADLHLENLPISPALREVFGMQGSEELALSGGDDYELLFTVSPQAASLVESAMLQHEVQCTPIGVMTAGTQVRCFRQGALEPVLERGYDHFR
jgi:thiamine-monophosphate kinase